MNTILLSIILLLTGIYCILSKRNLIKTIAGCLISQNAVLVLLLCLKSENSGIIITILAGMLAGTLFLSVLALKTYEKFKTYDLTNIRDLNG
jgi:hydrogenase-4 membrane subunit HyfE